MENRNQDLITEASVRREYGNDAVDKAKAFIESQPQEIQEGLQALAGLFPAVRDENPTNLKGTERRMVDVGTIISETKRMICGGCTYHLSGTQVGEERFTWKSIIFEVYAPKDGKYCFTTNSPMDNPFSLWTSLVIEGHYETKCVNAAVEMLVQKGIKHTFSVIGTNFTLTIDGENKYCIVAQVACYANGVDLHILKDCNLEAGSWKTPF
jgi:hypothetical protein